MAMRFGTAEQSGKYQRYSDWIDARLSAEAKRKEEEERLKKIRKAEAEEQQKKQWKDAVTRAQKKLIELTESPRDDVALNAVKYILSSNGYDAPTKIEADVDGSMEITIDYGED